MMQLKSHELAVETSYTQHPNGSSSAEFNLVPGPGTHYFRFKGAWMRIVRERDAKLMDLHSGTPWETVVLTTLSKDRELFKDLLREAREWSERETEGKTVVYTAWGVEWRPFGKPRRRREMGSVVLGEGVSERIEKDLRSFLGRGRWYADRGECLRYTWLLLPLQEFRTDADICFTDLQDRGRLLSSRHWPVLSRTISVFSIFPNAV